MLDLRALFGFSDALLFGCVCEVEEGLVGVDGWVVGCSLVREGYRWERGKDGFGGLFTWWLLVSLVKREKSEERKVTLIRVSDPSVGEDQGS